MAQINHSPRDTFYGSLHDYEHQAMNEDASPENGFATSMALDLSQYFYEPLASRVTRAKFVLYSGNTLLWSSAFFDLPVGDSGTPVSRVTQSVPNVLLDNAATLRWGIYADATNNKFGPLYGVKNPENGTTLRVKRATNGPETNYANLTAYQDYVDQAVSGYLQYTPNSTPSQGVWRSPPTPNGTTTTLTPTFEGTIPHPSSDAAYDYTTDVQLQIYPADDPANPIYNTTFAVTSTERTQGYFSRVPVVLTQGVTYEAKFRHKDRFGVWSPYSAETLIITQEGGSVVPVSPTGKLNALSTFNYTGTYAHAQGLSTNAAQVQVYNAAGTTLLYDSGTVTTTVAPGGTITVAEFHADLTWNTEYTFKIRARDTNNNWSPYSSLLAFKTNAQPNVPTLHTPSGGQTSLENVFRCKITDPDGDPIVVAQIDLVNADTNVQVTGFNKAMTYDAATDRWTYTATTGTGNDLVLNTNYKWRSRGSDGITTNTIGYGAWSAYQTFRYAAVPTVTLLGPTGARTNRIKQPSAEYDPAGLTTYWTETARTVSDFIDRITGDDVAVGTGAWEATASATGDNRWRTPLTAVDGTKGVFLRAGLKKMSGTAASHVAIECYDASSVLISTVYPTSIATANATNIAGAWTDYGGIVWPIGSANTPALPTGTTQVRAVVTPSRNSAAVVRMDRLSLETSVSVPDTSARWLTAQRFRGYGDPDLGGFGEGGYEWGGTPGDSTSTILPVLDSASPVLTYHYSSAAGNAMAEFRVFVDKWNGQAWVAVQAPTTWLTRSQANNTYNTYTLTSGLLANEGRYRLKMEAKDTTGLVGSTPLYEFDVRYVGPPELVKQADIVDSVRAIIGFDFAPTPIPSNEFVKIEVLRETVDGSEPEINLPPIFDPTATSIRDYFPASGTQYRIKARVIQSVGAEQIASRWTVVDLTVDYFDRFFIKEVDDPVHRSVPFKVVQGSLPVRSEHAPSEQLVAWGKTAPATFIEEARWQSGNLVVHFYDDPEYEDDKDTRYDKLIDIIRRRRTCVLLSHLPADKIFVAIIDEATRGIEPITTMSVAFNWTEVEYSEDFYVRNPEE
jgi:hypothetical protein